MASTEPVQSIQSAVSAERVVKRSKFIAHASPARSPSEASTFVNEISASYRDATHNCFAYKVSVGEASEFRFSDAGEPSGTAGRPILHAIESKALTNLVIVVARYFGGTKLGTGGLIRAYSGAALAALDEARVVSRFPQIKLQLRFTYRFTNSLHRIIARFGSRVVARKFGIQTTYLVQLKARDEVAFTNELRNLSGGKIAVERFNGSFY